MECTIPVEEFERLLKIARENGMRGITIDFTNRKIEVLSGVLPTMKKDGTRLMLSDDPAWHRDILGFINVHKFEV